MDDVECPVDGCEYSGEKDSVEAHISSSTDGEHSGKSGSEFRSELQDGSAGEQEPDDSEAVSAEDLAETAEEEDENGLGAVLLIGAVLVALFLFGEGSGSNRSGL
jgi:hypothetical protein